MANTLKEAIEGVVTQSAIAAACNVSQQAVSLWIMHNKVPAKRAKRFHEVTGIPLHNINPEVFAMEGKNG